MRQAELVIIGAGAAGMAAAIFAGEAATAAGAVPRIALLDGARRPGAKILVSGGGRCNVTNERVTPEDYEGGPRPMVRSVLRAFDEEATVRWMAGLGVQLKREPTGKLFPVSDDAHTVLDALTRRLREVGAELHAPARVTALRPLEGGGFDIALGEGEGWRARRVIVATGGLALPKSGSDGVGLAMLRALGHAIVPVTPALVPLVLEPDKTPGGRFAELAGLTVEARLGLYDASGRRRCELTRSLLFTHFGLSGPAAMDFSRHWLRARLEDREERWLAALGHPSLPTVEIAEAWLRERAAAHPRQGAAAALAELWPERLARLLGEPFGSLGQLRREERRELATRLARLPLPVHGDRGYSFAETSAGGVDLREVDVRTMESRRVPGLHLCGELLDVDGRIGGFNFQWAWATGYLAGRAAAAAVADRDS